MNSIVLKYVLSLLVIFTISSNTLSAQVETDEESPALKGGIYIGYNHFIIDSNTFRDNVDTTYKFSIGYLHIDKWYLLSLDFGYGHLAGFNANGQQFEISSTSFGASLQPNYRIGWFNIHGGVGYEYAYFRSNKIKYADVQHIESKYEVHQIYGVGGITMEYSQLFLVTLGYQQSLNMDQINRQFFGKLTFNFIGLFKSDF